MKHVNRISNNDFNERQLSIEPPEHDPLITPQAAVVLLRLIRNVNRKPSITFNQEEKS
jgi:hypothetical protein